MTKSRALTKREKAIQQIVAYEIKVIADDLYADLEDDVVTVEDLIKLRGRLFEDLQVLVGVVAKTVPDVSDDEVVDALKRLIGTRRGLL
jgi:hypothetical protein